MGKIKSFVQEFLETVGYDNGYDWDNLPSMSKMEEMMELDWIVNNKIDIG
jgi:hypothetical protein|tara:strand:- start:92 stop:241 length:150 start_codon:yes stop_codon:yes gene_type:complete